MESNNYDVCGAERYYFRKSRYCTLKFQIRIKLDGSRRRKRRFSLRIKCPQDDKDVKVDANDNSIFKGNLNQFSSPTGVKSSSGKISREYLFMEWNENEKNHQGTFNLHQKQELS